MKKVSAELDGRVSEKGELLIPWTALSRLNVRPGRKVHIRVTTNDLSQQLKRRNVTEEEIERIAALQLEPRENVARFLATESTLSGAVGFKRRAQEMRSKL